MGSVLVKDSPLPSAASATAVHCNANGHEMLSRPPWVRPAVLHVSGPAVGSVEVSTLAPSVTAHRETVGHETALRGLRASMSRPSQVEAPPVGSVDTVMLPVLSAATTATPTGTRWR